MHILIYLYFALVIALTASNNGIACQPIERLMSFHEDARGLYRELQLKGNGVSQHFR